MKQAKKKTGILGGSFNPIHNGHIAIAQDATLACGLNEVLFVPCNIQPHKDFELAPASHRHSMIALALQGHANFFVSDVDIRRGGVSYSIDTVRQLAEELAESELFFIIGSDALSDLHRWRSIEQLIYISKFVIMERPGFDAEAALNSSSLPEQVRGRLIGCMLKGRRIDISSSEIRARIAAGKSVAHMVPSGIEAYIAAHRLYELK